MENEFSKTRRIRRGSLGKGIREVGVSVPGRENSMSKGPEGLNEKSVHMELSYADNASGQSRKEAGDRV